ncbi:MAG: hypothetical protein AAB774_03090 [Patescibacteria group bacterium]
MKMRFLLVLVATLFNGIACAQLNVPALREGQFVYTIPEGFNPPMIGNNGIDEIERAAKSCHFPYYVILVETLPGSGDGDQLAANAINNLAQQWGQRYPSFDMARSQIFLLAYSPRKYRFLAGSKFETELNFRSRAHDQYTDVFKASTQGQRKDPKNGIINMMRAVDDYLFDQTDPAKIAQRREAARRQAEQERLIQAQGLINERVTKLDELLRHREYLPGNVSGYKQSLDEARKVRQRNNPQEMLNAAAALKPDVDKLEGYVSDRMSEEARRELDIFLKCLWAILILVAMIVAFLSQLRRYSYLRERFAEEFGKRVKATTNAAQQFFAIYGDRGDILALTAVKGKTKEAYESVTKEVDDIYLGVEALRDHAERCKAVAKKAGYFNLKPLNTALAMLNSPFDFDTGKVNKDSLFEPETKVIKINPTVLAASLAKRFEQNVEGWQELKDALAARGKTAEESFPSKTLDELYAKAKELGIPQRWLQNHPLAGDDSKDSSLYASVNALSWDDPIAYVERLNELHSAEQTVVDRFNRLVDAIALARSNRMDSQPEALHTVVDPDDDPTITFNLGRRAEDKLAGTLASADDVAEVEAQAGKVNELYTKAADQAATIKSAIKGAQDSVTKAETKLAEATEAITAATLHLTNAQKVHAKVQTGFVGAAESHLSEGKRDLDKARRQLGENRHLNARNNADWALEKFSSALEQAKRSVRHCDELDQKKAEFEKRVAKMKSLRDSYQRKIEEYGGSLTLKGFNQPQISDVTDYVVLLALLDQNESSWEGEARKAQRAYEEEERQRQAQEAAAKRRREEEDERQRQSSYESSTSSSWGSSGSGGSWGGGGDSSSGGSFGGGGDSSSGGDW